MAHSPTVKQKIAGRITHDERGNAVLKRSSNESTSTMLKRLELPGLKVEGQEDAPSAAAVAASGGKAKATPRHEPGGGYNPYDQSRAVKKPTTPKAPVVHRRPR